jgi:predicted AAA+ superfamily ATPase
MDNLLARHIAGFAEDALRSFPALVIQGARQAGKSTFATQLASARPSRMLTLDDDDVRAAALDEPRAFVEQAGDGTMIIDELQRAPELLLAIKASIDRNRRPGRFILTGSSNLLRLSRTPESLAGRAVTVELKPLSMGELRQRPDDLLSLLRAGTDVTEFRSEGTRATCVRLIAKGGYPEIGGLQGRMRNAWFDSYAERLMERDLRDIAPRVDPGRVMAVLKLIAANQAGELVKARLARDADVPETSMSAYLDLLSTMYLTSALPPWTPNLTSREAARRKVLVGDSGLALRLSRVAESQLEPLGNPHLGAALEGFVAAELMKQRSWSEQEYELFHFRDRDGVEVDIVAEFADGGVIAFEVKAMSTLRSDHFKGLRFLRDKLGDRFLGGYVLNTADSGTFMGDRMWGLPATAIWEL